MEARDRMPMPPSDELTAEQRAAAEEMRAGPRGEVVGPFVPLIRSPELMRRLQRVGEHLRFGDVAIEARVREFAVLMIARHWSQEFEWAHHLPLAIEAGVPPEVCTDLAAARRPADLPDDLACTHGVLEELLSHHTVSRETYDRAVEQLGEAGLVELVATSGYYTTLAMIMNTVLTSPPGDEVLPSLP
jgi:4-carboxymuconolactone decarboxylase